MWFKRYSVSILNTEWQPIRSVIKVRKLPRSGELIYLADEDQYYQVLKVVHSIGKKQGIWLVVDIVGKPQ